jgi:choline dehydrogenase-like flavoprotein
MYDAVIVGSGLGGAFAAHRLVEAGWRVLLLERGSRVARGPECSKPGATLELTPHYSLESAYRVDAGGHGNSAGGVFCLGGPSVYYGAAAIRYREADFLHEPEITGASGTRWPFGYGDLEPHYGEAERLMGVAGDDGADPTRPARSQPFPHPPAPLFAVSSRFAEAALAAGTTPVPLPLAVNYKGNNGRSACTFCRPCDTFACAVSAKNDMEVALLTPLVGRGLEVKTEAVVTRLVASDGAVGSVQGWDKAGNRPFEYRGRHVILAAGALASPHLLLASGLDRHHPSGRAVGRYLTRHCSAIVMGFCNFRPDPEKVFHKQIILFDYYFGDTRTRRHARRRLGSIQQVTPPPDLLMKAHLPGFFDRVPLHGFVEHLAGVLVMAEDEPLESNGVTLDPGDADPFGMPRLRVSHRYTRRDLQRRTLLVRRAKRILRRVGAWSFYTHNIKTFSHALGTVRMGVEEDTSPLDGYCRFRGLRNLLVVDGSALPTAAAVNPGLTIAANALRAADRLVKEDGR